MFELEREVRAWSEAVYASRCRSAASVAELSDHLYCEIDRARAEGMSDEQSFKAAVAKLGSAGELAAEHAKGRSWLSRFYASEVRAARGLSGPKQAWLLVAHGILWGAAILATALVMKKHGGSDASQTVILFILVPGWLGSEQLLRAAMSSGSRKAAR